MICLNHSAICSHHGDSSILFQNFRDFRPEMHLSATGDDPVSYIFNHPQHICSDIGHGHRSKDRLPSPQTWRELSRFFPRYLIVRLNFLLSENVLAPPLLNWTLDGYPGSSRSSRNLSTFSSSPPRHLPAPKDRSAAVLGECQCREDLAGPALMITGRFFISGSSVLRTHMDGSLSPGCNGSRLFDDSTFSLLFASITSTI